MTVCRCLSFAVLACAGGCLFLPAIDDDGYVACDSNDDCAPGRACIADVNLCAPPPWHDEEFVERRLLVVQNEGAAELPAGAAVPVRIGPGGVLSLEDVEADARFADYDFEEGRWRDVGVYRDLFRDRFDVWIPLSRALPAGGRDALAWLEQKTSEGGVRVIEDPARVFALFDDCDDFPVDGDPLRFVDAPGAAAPIPGDGTVQVGDNVKVVWRSEVAAPSSVTFRATVNGITCSEVFIGLTSSDDASFTPPAVGFFIDDDLQTIAEVTPSADAAPTQLSPPRVFSDVPNDVHRFTVVADGSRVRLLVDDVVFDESQDIEPGFSGAPLYPTLQVGGNCSVDVDAVWVTPLPFAAPTVTAEAPVQLNITF